MFVNQIHVKMEARVFKVVKYSNVSVTGCTVDDYVNMPVYGVIISLLQWSMIYGEMFDFQEVVKLYHLKPNIL